MKLPDGMRLVEAEDCVPVEHALVTFTTGSTGFPKLMLRKHGYERGGVSTVCGLE